MSVVGCDYLAKRTGQKGTIERSSNLLQVDVGLHDLLQRMAGQRGVVVQEVREGLVVLQKVLQLEIYDKIQKHRM